MSALVRWCSFVLPRCVKVSAAELTDQDYFEERREGERFTVNAQM